MAAKDKKLAGLLVSYSSKDQISHILPVSIIEHFLKDLEDGEYGECLECGEDILPERLEVVPHATLCRICANKAEQAS